MCANSDLDKAFAAIAVGGARAETFQDTHKATLTGLGLRIPASRSGRSVGTSLLRAWRRPPPVSASRGPAGAVR